MWSLLTPGLTADVLHVEETLGVLAGVPVTRVRTSLADSPVTLPPFRPAAATAPSPLNTATQ